MTFRKGLGKSKMSGLPSWGVLMGPRHRGAVGVGMGEAQLSPLCTSGSFRGNRGAGVGRTLEIHVARNGPWAPVTGTSSLWD